MEKKARTKMRQPQWIDQAIFLTRTVMERWYDLDADFILPLLAPSASWIGAAQGQYYLGQDEVAEALRQVVAALRPCKLTNQHYDAAPLAADSCVVTGHIVVTLEEQDKLLTEPQRVTMVWYRQGDQLLLAHIHVSNNAAVVAPDEQFPIRASRSAYRYLQDRLAEKEEMCTFCASDGTWHHVKISDVSYLEANNEYTLVCVESRTIRVHRQLGMLQLALFPHFLCIHRSYYVNQRFVRVLRPYEMELTTGAVLPVSRGRYKAVRAQLTGAPTPAVGQDASL